MQRASVFALAAAGAVVGRPGIRSKLLFVLFALGIPVAGVAAPEIPAPSFPVCEPSVAPDSPPEGLARSDWAGIRAAHEDWRHRFRQEADGRFSTRNPGQQWESDFDGRGFLVQPDHGAWAWGLELRSYGIGEKRVDVEGEAEGMAEKPAGNARLLYQRDAILDEWFRNDARGLEQGWTLSERPAGPVGEKLSLDLAVRGGLRPEIAEGGRAVCFVDEAGAAALTYGGLKAWDATGRVLGTRFVPGEAATAGAGAAGLRIEVDERGAVYPVTIDPIAQQAYLKASNTDGNDWFGYSVAVDGDTVVVGARYEDSSATGVGGSGGDDSAADAGAAYVFVRSGGAWSQQAYLKASNTDADDFFGHSVSVDGNTVVVGAFGEDSAATGVGGDGSDDSASFSGAAYVFVRSGSGWGQQAYLKASNTGAGDEFGYSVSVSGDTVVVGAPGEDSNASGVDGNGNDDSAHSSGAAYVFARNGSAWSQQAYLKASNSGGDDEFGFSVDMDGDTVVVGARYESSSATGTGGNGGDNSAADAGAAYVFARNGTVWSQQAYLKASNTDAGDRFAQTVAVGGGTVVVGARYEDSIATGAGGNGGDNSATSSGAVYVFRIPAPAPVAGPDITRPALRFLKKSRLKTPRARHKIVGVASDNEAVAKVEVKSRLAKGWRKAKLRASGRWIHRTPRLGSGRNKFKVRAEDVSGNRSRVKRVKAVGR